jgi:hypothetical protein
VYAGADCRFELVEDDGITLMDLAAAAPANATNATATAANATATAANAAHAAHAASTTTAPASAHAVGGIAAPSAVYVDRRTTFAWDDARRELVWAAQGGYRGPTAYTRVAVELFVAGAAGGPERAAVRALQSSGSVTF